MRGEECGEWGKGMVLVGLLRLEMRATWDKKKTGE